ncbi:MAG: efflux RND transporter permease subunit [Kiritimatiellae bacterium]|nr:efflux RND transporter permease subunit [Kiritimatiellia bacterium]
MNIAEVCIKKPTVTVSLAVALLLAGILGYFNLGRLEDPEFTIKNAQIITLYPGATAEEVANEVTDPLETAVQQMGQLKRVTSTSYPGKSIILVEMKDKYDKNDLPQIWDELRRKVGDNASSLPAGCSKPMVYDDYGDVYGVLYAIYGDGFTEAELKEHAKLLRRELLLCDDVAKIDLLGDRQEIVSFEMSRAKMANLGITPEAIQRVVEGQNVAADAGHIRVDDKYVRIFPSGAVNSVKDFEKLMITVPKGDGSFSTVHLSDILTVSRDYKEPPTCIVRYNGKPCVGLGISTVKGGNVMTMGASIDKRMKELLAETPVGIEVGIVSHQSSSVETAVNGFVVNLIESVVIVIAVLLFTMGMRSGLLIGGVLILTVMATVMVMDMMGIIFERISLGAFIIALGMLVDNAIVITEAVLVAAERGESRTKAAIAVVTQTQWPLLGATVVAILSFAPIGASQDSTGEYCRSLFLVLMISLLMSWVLAITVTPLLASKFLKRKETGAEQAAASDPYAGSFFRAYRGFLEFCIVHRGLTWIILGAMLAASAFGFTKVKQNFFPESTRSQFMVHIWMPEGSSIRATEVRVAEMAEAVGKLEGVTGVTSVTGGGGLRFLLTYTPEDNDDAYGILFVDVKDYRRISELMAKSEAIAADLVPDALVYGQKFVLGPGDAQKIQFRIMGPDPKVLRAAGEKALGILRDDGDLKEIQSDWRNRVDMMVPVVAEVRARKLGVTRSDIARSLKEATLGLTVGSYLEDDETLPIILRAPREERDDPNSLRSSWVWSSALGCSVPFAQVATAIRTETEEARLRRRNRLPCITVKCNPRHGTAAEARLKVRDKLEALATELPPSYSCEWGGEYESSSNANAALKTKIPPILAVMVLIVITLFNSARQALVIFMTVPLIVVGVVSGLLGFDQPFGFMALLGFLSLVGMQIKNAIVLMDEINAQLASGAEPFDAIVSSGVTRLRPVANAALTTILGMMPLVTDAFYAAMAVTIMCGLAFATVLTMVVIPVNYALVYRVRRPKAEAKGPAA